MKPFLPFVNVKSDDDFKLLTAFMLAAMRPKGPFPVLGISGEHGSAKSTTAGVIRSVIDPNISALRSLPRDAEEVFIAAANSHMLVFDNVGYRR